MGKKYFITGVSSGMGKALCSTLLSQGNTAYGVSRGNPDIHSDNFLWRSCDVSDPDEIKKVIDHQDSIGFFPDVVILNAGIHAKEGMEFVFDEYLKMFKVNSEGALRWVEAYLPSFKRRNLGHFVYISSLSALFPFPFRSAYSASKRYVSTVFSCLKKQYADTNITFTIIYPGLLDTRMSSHVAVPALLKYPLPKAADKIINAIAKRKGTFFLPVRNLLLEILLYMIPDRWLLRLLGIR